MKSEQWKTYRTRFFVKAKQLSSTLSFVDHLGRQHCGRKGDYLVESSDGVLSIAPRRIFEDIYVPMSAAPTWQQRRICNQRDATSEPNARSPDLAAAGDRRSEARQASRPRTSRRRKADRARRSRSRSPQTPPALPRPPQLRPATDVEHVAPDAFARRSAICVAPVVFESRSEFRKGRSAMQPGADR